MFARFTAGMNSLQIWDMHLDSETSSRDVSVPEEVMVFDLDALRRRTVLPLSDNNTWKNVTGIYGNTILPTFKSFQDMIRSDFECIAQTLLELELPYTSDVFEPVVNPIATCPMNLTTEFMEAEQIISTTLVKSCSRRRRKLSLDDHSFVLPSPHPSIPAIVITPCQEEHDVSARLPLQNSAFRNQLTVPTHPAFNHIHPPLALTPHIMILRSWKWQEGHWKAVIPSLDEQAAKGLFSRPLVTKSRRAWQARLKP